MAGGCQLNEQLLVPLATKHGTRLLVHYGLTEGGGGTPMFGGRNGDLNAMRPLDAATAVLVDEAGAESEEEGELVFLGLRSATSAYIGHLSDKLTRGGTLPTSERLHTGDVFRCVVANSWFKHVCRRDDLILHSTGEMTNPVPIEQASVHHDEPMPRAVQTPCHRQRNPCHSQTSPHATGSPTLRHYTPMSWATLSPS